MSNQKVLIIGGGVAGISAIVGLRKVNKDVEITLVEPKEYMEISWGSYRMPFDEKVAKKALCPLDKPNGKDVGFCSKHDVIHVKSVVTKLSKDEAVLENGDSLEYDVCVVATGATTKWDGMGKGLSSTANSTTSTIEGRLESAKKEGERILNSGSVCVVGGGLIGAELAGEIMYHAKEANKDMTVTLVHSGGRLCPEVSEKASAMVQKQLKENSVNVILKERVKVEEKPLSKDKKYYLESSGKEIDANEIILTVGILPSNDFLTAGEDFKSCINENGWVDTDEFFRVKYSEGKLFSIGDCCTTMPNAGKDILENVATVGQNINATLEKMAKGESVDMSNIDNLKEFVLALSVTAISTNPKNGVFDSPIMTTSIFFPWIKNKTLFFFQAYWKLGVTSVYHTR